MLDPFDPYRGRKWIDGVLVNPTQFIDELLDTAFSADLERYEADHPGTPLARAARAKLDGDTREWNPVEPSLTEAEVDAWERTFLTWGTLSASNPASLPVVLHFDVWLDDGTRVRASHRPTDLPYAIGRVMMLEGKADLSVD